MGPNSETWLIYLNFAPLSNGINSFAQATAIAINIAVA